MGSDGAPSAKRRPRALRATRTGGFRNQHELWVQASTQASNPAWPCARVRPLLACPSALPETTAAPLPTPQPHADFLSLPATPYTQSAFS